MSTALPKAVRMELSAIERLCSAPPPLSEFCGNLIRLVDRVVPSDLAAMFIFDPITGLLLDIFGKRVPDDGFPALYLRHIYLRNEAVSFLHMKERGRLLSLLSEDADGNLEADPRYRELFAPYGFRHDVRVCFPAAGYHWGALGASRGSDVRDFDDVELAFLERIASPVGEALRLLSAGRFGNRNSSGVRSQDTAVISVDSENQIVSTTHGAESVLTELQGPADTPADLLRVGVKLPVALHSVAARLRASTVQKEVLPQAPRLSLIGPDGRWWTVTALRDDQGQSTRDLSIVVTPSQPLEVAAHIFAAFDLTPRERVVVECVGRGLNTTDMAKWLGISPYTVQDHMKSIFAKLGLHSRTEVMSMIFREASPLGRWAASVEQ